MKSTLEQKVNKAKIVLIITWLIGMAILIYNQI